MKRLNILILTLLSALTLASCWDDSEDMEGNANKDLLRTTDIEMEATDQEATLHIEATCHWTLTLQGDSWLTPASTQGDGTADVRLTATMNLQAQDRTTTLLLTNKAGINRIVSVRQKAMTGIPENKDNLRPDF